MPYECEASILLVLLSGDRGEILRKFADYTPLILHLYLLRACSCRDRLLASHLDGPRIDTYPSAVFRIAVFCSRGSTASRF